MSVPTDPTATSPFIRSTSASDVYYLQSGIARLVPNAATFNYMAHGEGVRTLNDADFQAIPKGTPMPSRADGTILNVSVPAGTRLLETYLMQGGLRRAIPDAPTLSALEKTSGQPRAAAIADLNTIPAGIAMPSRADGTVYQGSGSIFAYVLKNAASPPCRTPPPSGTRVTIRRARCRSRRRIWQPYRTATPLPSTSKFLHPPSAAVFRCCSCQCVWKHASKETESLATRLSRRCSRQQLRARPYRRRERRPHGLSVCQGERNASREQRSPRWPVSMGQRGRPGSRAPTPSRVRRPRNGRVLRSQTCCRSGGSLSAIRTPPGQVRCSSSDRRSPIRLPSDPTPMGPG